MRLLVILLMFGQSCSAPRGVQRGEAPATPHAQVFLVEEGSSRSDAEALRLRGGCLSCRGLSTSLTGCTLFPLVPLPLTLESLFRGEERAVFSSGPAVLHTACLFFPHVASSNWPRRQLSVCEMSLGFEVGPTKVQILFVMCAV